MGEGKLSFTQIAAGMNSFGDLFPAADFRSGGEGGLFIFRVALWGSEVVLLKSYKTSNFVFAFDFLILLPRPVFLFEYCSFSV
ncbi:MAG: hypothetical protein PHF18_16065 [Methanosarcina sp.]|uniref:hypothetical protein n=1 Tax=Methanosarcina sp. TaxID=2213 RepID=UPI0026241F78|nr:hypothetical protein [Methanosarcina sp.]MDD3248345.1 hypothetical protein [Methanosarcina sp.]MDD4248478.1 hypothetical protein [Methanosarcina sp.]